MNVASFKASSWVRLLEVAEGAFLGLYSYKSEADS